MTGITLRLLTGIPLLRLHLLARITLLAPRLLTRIPPRPLATEQ